MSAQRRRNLNALRPVLKEGTDVHEFHFELPDALLCEQIGKVEMSIRIQKHKPEGFIRTPGPLKLQDMHALQHLVEELIGLELRCGFSGTKPWTSALLSHLETTTKGIETMGYDHIAQTFQPVHSYAREAPKGEQQQDGVSSAPGVTSSSHTDDANTVLLPCELPQNVSGLGINLTVHVPKDTSHAYISYQTDTSPPNLPALATLLEHVLIQLANSDEIVSAADKPTQ